ncbi:MAG: TrkH family potassium uptake protein [Clostridiales bacterium]|nr:TrkH family potassium uptake protein [Clostridiales bacterium]
MNYSIILYILGHILELEAVFMLLPCITALFYQETAGLAFLITALLCLVIGFPLTRKKPKKKAFYAKEGMVTVSFCWIALSMIGAVPFVICGAIPNPIDAFFEIVSGFTTTGSSILSDPSLMPHCVNMWRCFSHWIGGMGILVFVLALMPMTGGYHMNLMKAESPGPSVGRLLPKVQGTAKVLYQIYLVLTAALVLLLLLGRMSLFEALCTAFGTAGTGGFGVKADSLGGYSTYIQVVVTIFMILFGVNFNVYFLLLTRKFRQALKFEELRYYLFVILGAAALITWDIRGLYENVFRALQQSFFQVGSIITTTGFSTADFNQWPTVSKTILVMLMFIGACAGSTGGGIKVSRFLILGKSARKELVLYLHPNAVKKVKMDGKPIAHDVIRATNVYITFYILVFSVSLLLISFDGYDLVTNFTAVAATINNIGPGLELVGATGNYSIFSGFSKLVLSFDMLAGRLEMFPLLLLFARDTWKKF